MVFCGVCLFEARNDVGGRLSGSILGSGEHIAILKDDRNRFFLNRAGLLESFLKDSHEQLSLKEKVLELATLGIGDILCLVSGVFLWSREAFSIIVCAIGGVVLCS